MHADLGADGTYKISRIAFDGEEYKNPQRSIIELGLSIFHARVLSISIRMVEQAFNKEDILTPATDAHQPLFKDVPVRKRPASGRQAAKPAFVAPAPQNGKAGEAWGVVIPFRPRDQVRARAV